MDSRPRVVAYNAASLDGRLTLAPGVLLLHGDPRWTRLMAGGSDDGGHREPADETADEAADDVYAWLRATFDPGVFLEGAGSFLADARDRPASLAPAEPVPAHYLPPEIVEVEGRRWFTVVDGAGRVDLKFTEWPDPAWAGWHVLVLASAATPAEHLARLRDRKIPYLVTGSDRVDLQAALTALGEALGVATVVSTAGGRLQGALLRAGLLDEVVVDILPAIIGGADTPSLFDSPPLGPDEQPTPLELVAVDRLAGDRVRVHYRVAEAANPASRRERHR